MRMGRVTDVRAVTRASFKWRQRPRTTAIYFQNLTDHEHTRQAVREAIAVAISPHPPYAANLMSSGNHPPQQAMIQFGKRYETGAVRPRSR